MEHKELVEQWKDGWKGGVDSVLEFLKDMRGLEIEQEYNQWANADEYIKLNGEVVNRTY